MRPSIVTNEKTRKAYLSRSMGGVIDKTCEMECNWVVIIPAFIYLEEILDEKAS